MTTVTEHRKKLRRTLTSRAPRRVSGPVPARPAEATTTARGPAADAPASRPGRRSRPSTSRGVAARTGALVRLLPDHPLLDRIVRGRAWIPLLGVMLVGIVASQVEILKLGASVGRSVQRSTQLSTVNQQLQENVATLADDQRIERIAARMGMVMAPPTSVGFLNARRTGDAGKAIAVIRAPNPANFLLLTSPNGAVVTPADQSTTASGGTVTSSTGATTTGVTTTGATATGVTTTGATATTPTATTPTAPTSSVQASQSPGG